MRPPRHPPRAGTPAELADARTLDLLLDLYALERIRQVVRRELRVHGGQQTLAREIGISRGSLRKLLADQSTPSHAVRQRLQEWIANRPHPWTPPGAVALSLLVHGLPHRVRGEARRRLARQLRAIVTEAGGEVPDWLADEVRP